MKLLLSNQAGSLSGL